MIKVLRDATVVANAVTAASAAEALSVTLAEALTATWPAAGKPAPPVAVISISPPPTGAMKVMQRTAEPVARVSQVSIEATRTEVVGEVLLAPSSVKVVPPEPVIEPFVTEIPEDEIKLLKVCPGRSFPAESLALI